MFKPGDLLIEKDGSNEIKILGIAGTFYSVRWGKGYDKYTALKGHLYIQTVDVAFKLKTRAQNHPLTNIFK